MKKLLLLLFLFALNNYSFAQRNAPKLNHIRINFAGKKLENLNLVTTLDRNLKQSFSGQSKDGQAWEFAYPDSLYEQIKYFNIDNKNDKDTVAITVVLGTIVAGDTVACGSCHFTRSDIEINASFFKKDTYPKTMFKKNDESVGTRTEYEYRFFMNQVKDMELLSSMESIHMGYSYFYNADGTYSESLKKYINLAKKYPGSYGLIAGLAGKSNYYHSKEDIAAVYNLFSPKVKASYFGREIARNLTFSRFDNTMLLPWNSDKPETIVSDLNKFSLVVFSASWCAPCHEQLPIVKALHDKLGDKLDIIYVSMDEKVTVANWQKMTRDGEIPGRSLLTLNRADIVKKKYFVKAIPYSFLVYPGGNLEVVNVSLDADRTKVYQAISKSSK